MNYKIQSILHNMSKFLRQITHVNIFCKHNSIDLSFRQSEVGEDIFLRQSGIVRDLRHTVNL